MVILPENIKFVIQASFSVKEVLRKLNASDSQKNRIQIRKFIEDSSLDITHFMNPIADIKVLEKNLKDYKELKKQKEKERKQNPIYFAEYMLNSAKKRDKLENRSCDLTLELVQEMLDKTKNSCQYCENTLLKLTLDRIDNSIGHSKNNVKVACIRCNYIRGNMPYEAWLYLVPGVKEAVKNGLFGAWRSVALRTQFDADNVAKNTKGVSRLDWSEKICQYCQKSFWSKRKNGNRKFCSDECVRNGTYKKGKSKITKEALATLVWEKPISQIAKELGVTFNAVKKWCISYDILRPEIGYWAKKYANKAG